MSAITDSTYVADRPAAKWLALTTSPHRFWCGFWCLMLAACVPFLVPYFRSLWNQELYQYFPFLLLAVGYLFHLRWNRVCGGPVGRASWTIYAVGLGVLLLAAAIHSSWLGAVAFVLLATVFLVSQQSTGGGSLGYLALPLVMFIRVPQLHAQSLVVRLQNLTSQLTALVLDIVGVAHHTFGNVIHLPEKDLFVAEACSGIQSAFTMCFLALLIVAWKRRPLVTAPVYCAVGLVLAVLANTVRVSLIAIMQAWYAIDLSSGWMHDAVGYVSLAVAAGFLLSFDSFATLLFHPVDVPVTRRGANPLSVAWNYLLGFRNREYSESEMGWVYGLAPSEAETSPADDSEGEEDRSWQMPRHALAAGGVAALASVIMLAGFALGRSDSRPIVSKEAVLFNPPEDFLDGRIGVIAIGGHQVVRNGTDPQLGLHADIWHCATENMRGQVVMSQPYVGWHELCVCYEVQDWKLVNRYNLPVKTGKPVAIGEFVNDSGQHGYLVFTALDSDGSIPTPPSYTLFGRLIAPFGPLITDDFAETSGSAQTVMLQLWTVVDQAMEQEEIGQLANSVAEIREQARIGIVHQQHGLLAQQ